MARSFYSSSLPPYDEKDEFRTSTGVEAAQEADERAPLIRSPSYNQRASTIHGENRTSKRWRKLTLLAFASLFSVLMLGFSTVYWSASFEPTVPEVEVPVRIAIVGAGPAGISTAYTLNSLFALSKIPVNITVLEAKANIGGRLFLSSVIGAKSGLSIVQGRIHAEDVSTGDLMMGNQVLASRAKEALNYTGSGSGDGSEKSMKVGYFDGKEMKLRVVTTRPVSATSWSEWTALVWRYGSAVWRTRVLPTGTVLRFRRMTAKCGVIGKSIEGVEQWLVMARMLGTVSMGAEERLRKNGVGGAYVDDVVKAEVQRQWGQAVEEVNDLALSVGLEREQNGVGQSAGGRDWILGDVLNGFSEGSNAEVRTETEVRGLNSVFDSDGKNEWVLEIRDSGNTTHETFDHVVLAAPWDTKSLLSMKEKEIQEQISYRSQWLTFVVTAGKLNATYFGESDPSKLPDEILPVLLPSSPPEIFGISAITSLRSIFSPDTNTDTINTEAMKYLYRITSSHRLSKERLSVFFQEEIEELVDEEMKNAYPLLYPRSAGFGNFNVRQGLWHTGVGEAIVSGVDWSWAVGERISLMIWEELKDEKRRSKGSI